jgi:hypothetical protein
MDWFSKKLNKAGEKLDSLFGSVSDEVFGTAPKPGRPAIVAAVEEAIELLARTKSSDRLLTALYGPLSCLSNDLFYSFFGHFCF